MTLRCACKQEYLARVDDVRNVPRGTHSLTLCALHTDGTTKIVRRSQRAIEAIMDREKNYNALDRTSGR